MYDAKRAQHAIKFIQSLKHTKGKWAGKPFVLLKWQRVLIKKLFGTINEKGNRIYRKCYVEIPKKNGKSELGAAIALYLLFADSEMGAEIYSAAADREQASIVFNIAAQMVRMTPALLKRCNIIDSRKRIVIYATGSFYQVLSADVKTKHGFNTHGIIFDELHAQPNRDLWDVLTEGAGDAREQPLIFAITTAGYDKNSICYEVRDYALKVSKHIIKDRHFLSMIYSLDEKANWQDEKNWRKVNPSLDRILDIDRIRQAYNEAKEMPAKINLFRRLRLCQWTSQETKWMPIEKWDASKGGINPEELKGKICYGGLDLSSTVDISAFVLVFPIEGNYKVLTNFFIPADNIEQRVRKDKVPYDLWVQQGYIITTPGNVIDYKFIEDTIDRLATDYEIEEIAYDPWNATMLTQRIAEKGMTMVEVRQGFASMSAPTKQLEALILQKKIHHGDNPVLRWMFDNIMLRNDANENIKPDKEKSKEKIDGIIALILAVSRAMVNEDSHSVYETRGIITI
ncbi:MAG: terminase large subunit [Candidatus Pacearchaeota archaeon]|jgi:phage terminase large subunit-like protein